MKPKSSNLILGASSILLATIANFANAELIKMCLFYKVAGHARTDPILSQTCVSDHVHTFYGPQLFHPRITNEDLRNSDPKYSTSVYNENKSLYWHPTIYKVGRDTATGEATYEQAEISFAGPYYRWDKDAPLPAVEAFPPGFQMIAGMNPNLEGLNLFSECLCPKACTRSDGLCQSQSNLFPATACGEMGIAMAFPTCWDDSKGLGDTGDHMSHMAYTVDGTVTGPCPEGYNRRLPQIQLFVRISDYEGGQYTFSDNTLPDDEEVFHADFMNGWDFGVLENIIDQCQPLSGPIEGGPYNPPCNCDQFLTKKADLLSFDSEEGRNDAEAAKICPIDVTTHIVDEEIVFSTGGLPRGSCSAPLIEGVTPTFVDECGLQYTPNTFNEENCDVANEPEDEDENDNDNENNSDSADENENENEDDDNENNSIDDENQNQNENGSDDEIENNDENQNENESDEEIERPKNPKKIKKSSKRSKKTVKKSTKSSLLLRRRVRKD